MFADTPDPPAMKKRRYPAPSRFGRKINARQLSRNTPRLRICWEQQRRHDEAFLCRRTGKIYWRSEISDLDELNDELPDDVDDDEKYAAIPDKRELGLGKPMVLDFAREFLPRDFDEVRYIFSKRGAYKKFRALLIRRNVLERWYDFESTATERALREWCEFNSIEVTD